MTSNGTLEGKVYEKISIDEQCIFKKEQTNARESIATYRSYLFFQCNA